MSNLQSCILYKLSGIVHLALPAEPVTLAAGFLTEQRIARAKLDGCLPDAPEITPDRIQARAERILKPGR